MEPFEYVVVLTSLILGLGIAQILTGVADMVSHWRAIKISLPHTIYVLVIFLICLQEWWINYEYSKVITVWTFQIVLSILIFPILLFIQARLLFPTGLRSADTDMDVYFEDQWRWLYAIGAMTVLVSIWQNVFISAIPLMDQLQLFALLAVYFLFIVLNIKNKKAHTVFLSLQLIAWIVYIVVEDGAL
jgi:hypothetical protein